MVLEAISPDCGVWVSLMLFLYVVFFCVYSLYCFILKIHTFVIILSFCGGWYSVLDLDFVSFRMYASCSYKLNIIANLIILFVPANLIYTF